MLVASTVRRRSARWKLLHQAVGSKLVRLIREARRHVDIIMGASWEEAIRVAGSAAGVLQRAIGDELRLDDVNTQKDRER